AWACWRQAILCYRRGKQEMGAAMAVPVFGRGFAGGRNKKTPLKVFQVVGKKGKSVVFPPLWLSAENQ
ncbi:hypothetical protein PXW82_26840, partial [Klebsiella pneumoniae]|uniref:hypothetical protein n=1 Tax=Klebsiella pneumoniae TaxID=573 RepID=UPI0023815893